MLRNNPPKAKAIALPSWEFLPEVYACREANTEAVPMRTVARRFWLVGQFALLLQPD